MNSTEILLLPFLVWGVVALIAIKKGRLKLPKTRAQRTQDKSAISPTLRESPKSFQGGKIHGEEHTHDRLDYDCYRTESAAEHYKKQLDGFLDAGLIDRKEYLQLLWKFTKKS